MKYPDLYKYIIVAIFWSGVGQSVAIGNVSNTWFMEAVESASARAHLKPLQDKVPSKDIDVRIWIVQESDVLGFALRKNGHESVALRIRYSPRNIFRKSKVTKVAPVKGWHQLWKDLIVNGIFDLPDSSFLQNEKPVVDGMVVVIQFQRDGECGSYHYKNPIYQEWPEARRVMNILKVLAENFPRK